MSILLCGTCQTHFDPDIHVEAEYFPFPKCQDCVYQELEQQRGEWWTLLDQDEQAITDFCEDKL